MRSPVQERNLAKDTARRQSSDRRLNTVDKNAGSQLTFQNQGWSWGLVGSYLETQYQPDLGGFTFGVKYGWGPMGKGGGKGGHGHGHHGDQPHVEHH